ncbi:ubiquinol-cytochrome c reductase iron-sulfur subunit [Oryzihumus sp.]|jgi:ubiquinol-cytochrome c reductase iron-sulfur subunit|uniref:cytochrome bc1 complex Rieske iron-sulfur subunit n=1 Tax=Oryzihumus sp. TaxID=1968903 RepID=UPI002ED9D77F
MNEHGTEAPDGTSTEAVRLDQGHIEGTGGIPERFTNPGLPAHIHRSADVDEKAARKAEKQVATLFTLSIIGTLVFIVAYFAIDHETKVFMPGIGLANLQNVVLGVSLAVSLFMIGAGAVHWAKTLMPDEEVVEERHTLRSQDEDRTAAVATILGGGDQAQLGRRPLIKYTLGGALGLFAVPLVLQLAGGLGPLPGNALSTTFWRKGMKLMRDPEGTPIKASDVTIGSVFHVMPEGIDKSEHVLEEKGKAAVLLMRLDPDVITVAKERDWGHDGIVAYSKICTHVGCPVGLYEQQTHHLLCPCHQSTFDVTQDCKVIFGPAGRPLPQLKITVDNEGYLVADAPFREAVGPSFWERG